MRFSCDSCQARYTIADDKVRGKILRVRCKRCGSSILLKEQEQAEEEEITGAGGDDATRVVRNDEVQRAIERSAPQPAAAPAVSTVTQSKFVSRSSLQPVSAPPREQSVSARAPSKPAERKDWFVILGGKEMGPLARGELQAKAAEGQLTPRVYLWRDGMPQWARLKDIPELADLLAPAPASAPPSAPPAVDLDAQRRADEEREVAEALARAEAERAAEEAHRREEQEAKRKAEEERRAAEAKKKAEDEKRAAEAKKKADEERAAAEAKAAALKKAEEEKKAAEAKKKADEEAKAAAAAAAAKKAEEEKKAAEAKKAEDEKRSAEAKKKAEDDKRSAEAKKADDEKKAAEAKRAEDEKKAAAKKAEEEKKAAEAKKKADEEKAAALKKAEDEKKAAEAKKAAEKKADEEKKAAEAKKKADDEKKAAAKKAEDEKKAAAKKAEEEKKAAEKKKGEEQPKKRDPAMDTTGQRNLAQLADALALELADEKAKKADPKLKPPTVTDTALPVVAPVVGGAAAAKDAPPDDPFASVPNAPGFKEPEAGETTNAIIKASGAKKKNTGKLVATLLGVLAVLGGAGYLAVKNSSAFKMPEAQKPKQEVAAIDWTKVNSGSLDKGSMDVLSGEAQRKAEEDKKAAEAKRAAEERAKRQGSEGGGELAGLIPKDVDKEGAIKKVKGEQAPATEMTPEQLAMLATLKNDRKGPGGAGPKMFVKDDTFDVRKASATADGGLDRSVVAKKIGEIGPGMSNCVGQALRRNPDLKLGKVVITATVAPSGIVTGAVFDKKGVADSDVGECLRRVVKGVVFPAFDGEAQDIEIPLTIGKG